MEEENIKLTPFKVYYCGCFKVHNGYYCPECGFASMSHNLCNQHGEMQPCWVLDLVLFHPIEGLMNALISDYHLIQDSGMLQLIRGIENKDEVAGIVSALLPLLTPLNVYPIDIFPNRFPGYSSNITLKSLYMTKKPLVTNGDGKIRVVQKKDPKKVYEQINLEGGFKEDELVVVKNNRVLYLLSEEGEWNYKITYGKIEERLKLKGIFSTVVYFVDGVKFPITNVTPVEKGRLDYLDAVGIMSDKVYVVLNKHDKLASCGIKIHDNIMPPICGDDNE